MQETSTPSSILCPFCSKGLVSNSGQTHCHYCSEELPRELRARLKPRIVASVESASQNEVHSEIATQAEPAGALRQDSAKTRSPFVKRYLDLYRAARLLIAVGSTVKRVGIVLAIIVFVFWLVVGILAWSQTQPSSPFGPSPTTQSAVQTVSLFVCIVIGAVCGALIGGLFFLLGVLISAQGQLLTAHADVAVHTSPFLSDEERANAMSLPYSRSANKLEPG